MKIRFGTRSSRLALLQTETVISTLKSSFPDLDAEIVKIRTLGDNVTSVPLFQVGGQGLFIKEIERALLEREIDIAVHCLKDVPHQTAGSLSLGAIGLPQDPRDVLISRDRLRFPQLPQKARIGTSSLRRRAQLSSLRDDLVFTDMRGNLDTRLEKLDSGQVDAIVLAAAGLERLELTNRFSEIFSTVEIVPPAGQGLLTLQCRTEDLGRLSRLLDLIEDDDSRARAIAERAFLAKIQGGCQTPMGVYARLEGNSLFISAFIATENPPAHFKCLLQGYRKDAKALGEEVAENLLAQISEGSQPGELLSNPSVDTNAYLAAGKVALVGAGPGDPGLITVKGLELIKAADVIVYDQLGAPPFLRHARPDALLLDVGKRAGKHTVPQDGINQTLVDYALKGNFVVRLKGGDPMMFGRGGEELVELAKNGIPFEVVPGVSSAIAGPIYAGIPVTHRDCTPAMAVITGHESDLRNESTVPWESLAGINALIFLMGVKKLPFIAQRLIDVGKSPETPVAVIENATMPTQRTVVGTLATIAEIARQAQIKPPALIVTGDAVKFRDSLAWFERRPLFGKTIIVTRSRAQASGLSAKLTELGADVIECPSISIQPLVPTPGTLETFDEALTLAFSELVSRLAEFTHLVFTSHNGAECFFSGLAALKIDIRILAGARIACIGPATAESFTRRGIIPDFVPTRYIAEALLPYFEGQSNLRVGILRAEQARDLLPSELEKSGHLVEVFPLYRTVQGEFDAGSIIDRLKAGSIDLVTFTSSSTVDNFISLLPPGAIPPESIPAAAIGPITAETCRSHGLNLKITAAEYSIPGLVAELLNRLAD